MNRERIRDIAVASRDAFETESVSGQLLVTLYSAYNSTVEIDSFLHEASRLFPNLNCGVATVYLQYVLGTGKVINGRYKRHGHTFLSVGGHIVDITTDQFGGPKVYVGPLQQPWSLT